MYYLYTNSDFFCGVGYITNALLSNAVRSSEKKVTKILISIKLTKEKAKTKRYVLKYKKFIVLVKKLDVFSLIFF